ncbi:MAG: tRNA uridine-5-carboxymethylaminomethyl(34) synthesis GTPase MnmE [Isosphaeraceae bacterium]
MTLLDTVDTIAAIASPPGFGFRGIVRLSGADAWNVAMTGFRTDGRAQLSLPRRAGRRTGAYRLEGLRPELPSALLFWPGPRTYTGQSLAEIHTVGSPPLVQLMLAHCLKQGARQAEPGEFTLRAFLSGRIDLTRAEAVLGVIDARSPAQLEAALAQLAGGLASPIATLRDRLLDVLAHLEANLDFMDEPDVDELSRRELAGTLSRSATDTAALAGHLDRRDRSEGPPRVVLMGAPNAGKSRLFNALLGQTRALVSPLPGTTRDYLAAPCDCDGLLVELIDTAGEEPATSPIEASAQARRADLAALADLRLLCVPADDRQNDEPVSPLPHPGPGLLVRTKCDLRVPFPGRSRAIATSAETGEGLTVLRRAIASTLRDQPAEGSLATSTGARCRESLGRVSKALASASHAVTLDVGDELVAEDLRLAIDELGKVVGAVVTDDILDRIFRRFCIGK